MLKRRFTLLGVILLLVVTLFGWKFYFRFLPIFPHQSLVISLPFAPEDDELIFINPMGETDHHTPPRGHPGLDFGWYHPAPLIAVVDGKVTKIEELQKKEYGVMEKVYDVEIVSGVYATRYSEIVPAMSLEVGDRVRQGDIIGRGGKYDDGHGGEPGGLGIYYSVHWEFDFDTPIFDRLCPLTFFDRDSRTRIDSIWNKVGQTYDGQFPKICSGFYEGKIR